MKNSTILMTIIAIVFSLSNTFAQTTIIKSGLISNAIGIEVEHNILKSRYSLITGLSYSESFGHFTKSMIFEENKKKACSKMMALERERDHKLMCRLPQEKSETIHDVCNFRLIQDTNNHS